MVNAATFLVKKHVKTTTVNVGVKEGAGLMTRKMTAKVSGLDFSFKDTGTTLFIGE